MTKKKYTQLTNEQRYTIDLELKEGTSIKKIAEKLKRDPSTIYREIKRNKTKRGCYNYKTAQEYTQERRERNPRNKIPQWVITLALGYLEDYWSPEQISGFLRNDGIRISHEKIYQIIRADTERNLKQYCRFGLKHRKRDIVGKAGVRHIPNRTDISERPAEADGTRFGDWEMDTIVGKGNKGAIVTLVERSQNFLLMEKLPNGKESEDLASVVVRLLYPYRKYVKTITTDNGGEFADHQKITEGLALKGKPGPVVYFAKPYASWQKGAIENANMLIRQFIPKGADLDDYSNEYIKNAQKIINKRPRKNWVLFLSNCFCKAYWLNLHLSFESRLSIYVESCFIFSV